MSGHKATPLVRKEHLSTLFSHLILAPVHYSIIEDHDALRLLDLVVAPQTEQSLLFDDLRALARSLRLSLLVLVGRRSILPPLSPSRCQLLGAQALRITTWRAR